MFLFPWPVSIACAGTPYTLEVLWSSCERLSAVQPSAWSRDAVQARGAGRLRISRRLQPRSLHPTARQHRRVALQAFCVMTNQAVVVLASELPMRSRWARTFAEWLRWRPARAGGEWKLGRRRPCMAWHGMAGCARPGTSLGIRTIWYVTVPYG